MLLFCTYYYYILYIFDYYTEKKPQKEIDYTTTTYPPDFIQLGLMSMNDNNNNNNTNNNNINIYNNNNNNNNKNIYHNNNINIYNNNDNNNHNNIFIHNNNNTNASHGKDPATAVTNDFDDDCKYSVSTGGIQRMVISGKVSPANDYCSKPSIDDAEPSIPVDNLTSGEPVAATNNNKGDDHYISYGMFIYLRVFASFIYFTLFVTLLQLL